MARLNDCVPGVENENAVVIRALHPDEWEAYKKLRLEALLREPHAFGTPYADAQQTPDASWRSRLEAVGSTEDARMLFAERAGILVGMAAAYPKAPGAVEIVSVYVTASERGRGISRRLVETILRQIAANPLVTNATLTVNKGQCAAPAGAAHDVHLGAR